MKIFFAVLAALTISGHATASTLEVKIMRQHGITASPVVIKAIETLPVVAKEKGLDIKVVPLGIKNSGIGNEMLVNRQLDIHIGPFIGFGHLDAAQDGQIKMISNLQRYQGALICQPSVKGLSALRDHKIAMHNLGSTQHLMLRQIAKQQFGDFYALDKNIAVMPDQVSTQMMIAGDESAIQCHCCKAPEQNLLMNSGKGFQKLVQADDRDIYSVTMITYARADWLEANPKIAEAWIESLRRAIASYNRDPLAAIKHWIEIDRLSIDADKMLRDSRSNNQTFTIDLFGADQYLKTLRSLGMIKGRDKSYGELVWRPELPR